jgi:D-threo-aldose 1-dehydrogenase
MQFPLRHAATAAVVAGVRTPQQARSTVQRALAELPTELWADLEEQAPNRD